MRKPRIGQCWDLVSRIGRIETRRMATRNPVTRPVSASTLSQCIVHVLQSSHQRSDATMQPHHHIREVMLEEQLVLCS
jgi:hypothetical protein